MTLMVKESDASVGACARILKRGGIVVFPTETAYGLGADATNHRAIEKVFEIKGRQKERKISVAFSDLNMAKKYVYVGEKVRRLARKFLPGPLTIISNGDGFRIPDRPFVLKVIKKLGRPITATSANTSGKESLYKISDIKKQFYGKVDMIIDGGNLAGTRPSTVYDVDLGKVLRKGPITREEIEKALELR